VSGMHEACALAQESGRLRFLDVSWCAMQADELYRALKAGCPLQHLRAPGRPLELQGHFSTVLLSALSRLDRSDPAVMEHFAHVLDDFALLFDGFPKSRVHLLVLPRKRITSARDLTAEHVPLLRRLAAYTAWIIESLTPQYPDLTWRHGVHVNPSLKQLHVHVISQDFRSPCLKNKKHYNSFQPPFLVSLDSLILSLQGGGEALGDIKEGEAEQWLKQDLKCTACGLEFGNKFTDLKRHLESCRPPASAPLPALWQGGQSATTREAEDSKAVAAPGPPQMSTVTPTATSFEGHAAKRHRAEVVDLTDE